MKELIDEHGKRTHLPPHLDHIDYSGGDPMCNKHWKEIILVGKKYFPKSTVMIRSSGYLLPTMKDEDWKFLADMH
jgi:MoaA/NifB/PqqE/SkfB family radical SAM enzyme